MGRISAEATDPPVNLALHLSLTGKQDFRQGRSIDIGSASHLFSSQTWIILKLICLLFSIQQNLNNNSLPGFLDELSNVTLTLSRDVIESPPTISAIVDILDNVVNTTLVFFIQVTETLMEVF